MKKRCRKKVCKTDDRYEKNSRLSKKLEDILVDKRVKEYRTYKLMIKYTIGTYL